MKLASWVFVALILLGGPPAVAVTSHAISRHHLNAVLEQASPSRTTETTEAPTASPSPGEDDEGGIATGAGLVIAAILVGGLLLMRSRLLRR